MEDTFNNPFLKKAYLQDLLKKIKDPMTKDYILRQIKELSNTK